jgi:hypothetical protein
MKTNNVISGVAISMVMLASSFGCQNTTKETAAVSEETIAVVNTINIDKVPQLLASNCYICHDPKSNSHDELIAPPLAGIKNRYLKASNDKADFVTKMTSFVDNPTEEAALMKGPIKRFGLMPKTALDKEQIEAIVTYIHDNEIPAPSWFEEHEKEMQKN